MCVRNNDTDIWICNKTHVPKSIINKDLKFYKKNGEPGTKVARYEL